MDWGAIFSQHGVELISPTTAAYALAATRPRRSTSATPACSTSVMAGFMALGAYGYAISIAQLRLARGGSACSSASSRPSSSP